MLYACYCALPIVILRDVFFFMTEIVFELGSALCITLSICFECYYDIVWRGLSFYHNCNRCRLKFRSGGGKFVSLRTAYLLQMLQLYFVF